VTEFDSVIPAGGSGKLTAKMKTAATQQGAMSKSVAVTTDAPGAERLTLSMTFRAMPAVKVLPKDRVYLVGLVGEQPSTTLVLRRSDGEPLTITGVESSDPRLLVTTEKVEKSGVEGRTEIMPGDVKLIATVAKDVEAVTVNGQLSVHTNHPDAATIRVPVAFRLRSVIEPRPEHPVLVLEEGNAAGRNTLFRVQHNRRKSFRVTSLTPSAPDLFSAKLVDDNEPNQVHTLAITLADDVLPGAFSGRRMENLTVATDDPEQPELSVMVMVEARQRRSPREPRPLP
jgi:hypothetical protein